MKINNKNVLNENQNNDKKKWEEQFKKILTFWIAIIAITVVMITYMNDESRSEAMSERNNFSNKVFNETQNSIKFNVAGNRLLHILEKYVTYQYLFLYHMDHYYAAIDPIEREFHDFEINRSILLSTYWSNIFMEEISKITGNSYDGSTGMVSAMEDFNSYDANKFGVLVDIRDEEAEHEENAKGAQESSERMSLSIMVFSISTLLAGLSLIPEEKNSKYLLLIVVIIFYFIGIGVFASTGFS